jgi:hypothetical protein
MVPRRLLFLCVPLCLAGCSWLPYAIDNTTNSVSNVVHEYRFQREIARLANEAWQEFSCKPANKDRPTEFEKGFKAGYVDYLDCNGNGSPPASPPPHLRCNVLRTPKQQQDVNDWFAGFRVGAEYALQSGIRERVVIPLSLPPLTTEEGFREKIIPGPKRRDTGVPGVATFDTEFDAVDGAVLKEKE